MAELYAEIFRDICTAVTAKSSEFHKIILEVSTWYVPETGFKISLFFALMTVPLFTISVFPCLSQIM